MFPRPRSARADAHPVGFGSGRDRLNEVDDAHARDARHVQFAALHLVERVDHELHGLRECDPEAGHSRGGDRQRLALGRELYEERDDGAAATHDVAVAHDAEPSLVADGLVVRGLEQFVGGRAPALSTPRHVCPPYSRSRTS